MRLLPLITILLLTACAPRPETTTEGPTGNLRGKAAKVVKSLEKNAFDTEWMEGKARVKIESEKFNIGGTATIRLQRDEAIWVSVKKFGIEGARALIRPDSFFFYNRLKGEFTAEPLSYIETKYKIPARYDLLQDIVLGNAVFMTRDLELSTSGNDYVLEGRDNRYATRHVAGQDYKLKSMKLTELAQNRRLTIDNDDFRGVPGGEGTFPYQRGVRIDASGSGDGYLEMNFREIEVTGPYAMPFRRR